MLPMSIIYVRIGQDLKKSLPLSPYFTNTILEYLTSDLEYIANILEYIYLIVYITGLPPQTSGDNTKMYFSHFVISFGRGITCFERSIFSWCVMHTFQERAGRLAGWLCI